MPAASRITDKQSGHNNQFPPTISISGSGNVFINNLSAHRLTDRWLPHRHGSSVHSDITVSGSGNVFINGLSSTRVGDKTDRGAVIVSGSGNVFIGK